MRIRLILDDQVLIATLVDGAAVDDLVGLLPLTLTLRDFNGTEKIADLPSALSARGAPDGVRPFAGDITYYAPWGNLAIFYRDFRHSPGLIRLGKLDGGIDALAERRGDFPMIMELKWEQTDGEPSRASLAGPEHRADGGFGGADSDESSQQRDRGRNPRPGRTAPGRTRGSP